MNQDNALREALHRRTGDLPYGFDRKLMERILLEAERKSRKSYYRSLGLVSAVALALIGGAMYALYHFFSFNMFSFFASLPEYLSGINLQSGSGLAFSFYTYIALLVLILLGIDNRLRRRLKKGE